MSLLDLPPEVIEAVAVEAAASDAPSCIAGLAQTCRALRALIYGTSDRHLWREVFLSTFDDPRAFRQSGSAADFDWGTEFRRRVWARKYLRDHTDTISVDKSYHLRSKTKAIAHLELPPTSPADGSRLIHTLLSVFTTALPVNMYPEPPRALLTDNTLSYVHLQTIRGDLPAYDTASLNIQWLHRVLERGLPPGVIGKVSGQFLNDLWLATPEAQSLGRLICYTGFIPVPLHEGPGRPVEIARSRSSTSRRSPETPEPAALDMSTEAQEQRARYRGRERVYDMDYLKRRRHWGPFRSVIPLAAPSDAAVKGESASQPIHRTILTGSDLDSSSSDSDFVPPDEDRSGDSSATPPPAPEPKFEQPLRRRLLPTGAQLLPDWTWLGAARVICEANLRDPVQNITTVDVDQLCRWDGVREGAWVPAKPRAEAPEMSESVPSAKGKEKADLSGPGAGEVQGWDWAGVEGVWKRCVCWLDYGDLINHNIEGDYNDPTLIEAVLIVPLRLRIAGYSPPAVSSHTDRSTIRFEGEMGGPGWTGDLDGNDDIRRVHGTVSTVADGSIRWCQYTCERGLPREDQWASEGIQIGGVGSAIGILGLWTGAVHEDSDPIGPFWQWRVS